MDITSEVTKLIQENLFVNEDEVTPYAEIFADLDADELDLVELTEMIEERLNIEISDEEIDEIRTVMDFIDCVSRTTATAV